MWGQADQVFSDARLSATDKACWMTLVLRADITGGYHLGVRYLSRTLHVKWQTVRKSLDRLTMYEYIAAIHPSKRLTYWRLIESVADDDVWAAHRKRLKPMSPQTLPPKESPYMRMPNDLASEVIQYLAQVRHQLDTAMLSEAQMITEAQRTQWLAESDHLGELIDVFTRWLTRWGGGVPEAIRSLVD